MTSCNCTGALADENACIWVTVCNAELAATSAAVGAAERGSSPLAGTDGMTNGVMEPGATGVVEPELLLGAAPAPVALVPDELGPVAGVPELPVTLPAAPLLEVPVPPFPDVPEVVGWLLAELPPDVVLGGAPLPAVPLVFCPVPV